MDITNLYLPYQPYPLRTPKGTNYLLPEIASDEQTNGSQEPGEGERRGDGAPATAWRLGKRLAAESATRLGTAAAMSPTDAARASEESRGRSEPAGLNLGALLSRGGGAPWAGRRAARSARRNGEFLWPSNFDDVARVFHLFGHSAVRASGPLVLFRFFPPSSVLSKKKKR